MAIIATLVEYGLDISVSGNGTTEPAPGSYTYTEGTTVAITAYPDAGYKLDHWEMDGAFAGADATLNVTMDAHHAVVAYFVIPTFTVTIDATVGGTTDPAPGSYTYNYGDVATIRAMPNIGYYFSVWLVDGVTYSANPLSLTVNSDLTVTASFAELAKTTLQGMITDAETGTPIANATVTLDTASTSSDVNGNYSLTVTAGVYTLTVSANGYESSSQTVDLSAGGTQVLDVKLTKTPPPPPPPPPVESVIQGTITDAETGEPVADATATIDTYSTTSDVNGNFSITVTPSTYTLTVTKEGYEDWSQTIDASTVATYIVNVALTKTAPTPPIETKWIFIGIAIIGALILFSRR